MTLNLRIMHRAALASFKNAEAYLDDAKALIERSSYGHAFALLVLAEEEMGKAFFQLLEVSGFRMPKPVLIRHIPKQLVEVAVFNLFDFLLPSLRKGFERVGLVGDDSRRVGQAERLKESLSDQAEHKIELIRRGRIRDRKFIRQKLRQLNRLKKLQGRKMAGMYVDVGKDGTVSSPSDFSRAETLEYLEIVEGNLRAFVQTFGTVLTPAPEEHLRKVRARLRPVVVAFDPDLKRAISFFMDVARRDHV